MLASYVCNVKLYISPSVVASPVGRRGLVHRGLECIDVNRRHLQPHIARESIPSVLPLPALRGGLPAVAPVYLAPQPHPLGLHLLHQGFQGKRLEQLPKREDNTTQAGGGEGVACNGVRVERRCRRIDEASTSSIPEPSQQ